MVGLVSALLAWPLFTLAMPKHQRPLLGQELPIAVARVLRWMAWGMLGVGLAVFVDARGVAQGPVFWAASLVVTAIGWVLLQSLAPRVALAATAVAAVALLVAR